MEENLQDKITRWCAEWQKILRLQDWDVHVCLCRQNKFSDSNLQGECAFTLNAKQAVISILNPFDYSPDSSWPQDIEKILVHELLHLHFAEWSACTEDGCPSSAEQGIELTACALVHLKRMAGEGGDGRV